jgi:hypothetical protein
MVKIYSKFMLPPPKKTVVKSVSYKTQVDIFDELIEMGIKRGTSGIRLPQTRIFRGALKFSDTPLKVFFLGSSFVWV